MCEVTALPPAGMIALKADPGDPAVAAYIGGMLEVWRFVEQGGRTVFWMAPDEVLIVGAREAVVTGLSEISDRLDGVHHLATDVSDLRVRFAVEGSDARDVLARLCPIDLHPAAFGPGQLRRTRLAQVAAVVAMTGPTRFEIMAFRSVAGYVRELLTTSARDAARIGYF